MELLKPLLDEIRKIIRDEIQQAPMVENERWINTEELCEYLGVSRSWVSHRLNDIPHIKSPLRFKKTEVDMWIREKESEVTKKEVQMKTGQATKDKYKYKVT